RDHQVLARGLVAARLAAFDWPAAEALLDPVKDAMEYNRYVCMAADRIARTDVPAAKKLFDLFRPSPSFSNHEARLYVAYRAAAGDPDEAERIVGTVDDAAFRFQGLVGLAGRVAAKDKARAVRLIDAAVALLDEREQGHRFESWASAGGRAGFALLAVHKAKA